MILTIFDPLNHTNNLGKNSKAYELQTMFKAAFIALHANIKQEKNWLLCSISKRFLYFELYFLLNFQNKNLNKTYNITKNNRIN
jgi:hypothetical protein